MACELCDLLPHLLQPLLELAVGAALLQQLHHVQHEGFPHARRRDRDAAQLLLQRSGWCGDEMVSGGQAVQRSRKVVVANSAILFSGWTHPPELLNVGTS